LQKYVVFNLLLKEKNMCDYKFRTGVKCQEKSLPDSSFCILHVSLPEKEDTEDFLKMKELKEQAIKEKTGKGDFFFEGAKLNAVDFHEMTINGDVNFTNAVIKKEVVLNRAAIEGDVIFSGADIGSEVRLDNCDIKFNANFDRAHIGTDVRFQSARVGMDASFIDAKIGNDVIFRDTVIGKSPDGSTNSFGFAVFDRADIKRGADFIGATICQTISFQEATIGGFLFLQDAKIGRNALFQKAKIGRNDDSEAKIEGKNAIFSPLTIKGEMNFRKCTFSDLASLSEACRLAKKLYQKSGNRKEEDYHFFREMVARRKQRSFPVRTAGLIFQLFFGYGVRPKRVFISWLAVILLFAAGLWHFNGLVNATSIWDYIYFSILTSAAPGYAGYSIKAGFLKIVGLEAVIGTVFWAAFIATAARKYMR
jgi:uncharacterized protein YjbI with pentapeptide repeats